MGQNRFRAVDARAGHGHTVNQKDIFKTQLWAQSNPILIFPSKS